MLTMGMIIMMMKMTMVRHSNMDFNKEHMKMRILMTMMMTMIMRWRRWRGKMTVTRHSEMRFSKQHIKERRVIRKTSTSEESTIVSEKTLPLSLKSTVLATQNIDK